MSDQLLTASFRARPNISEVGKVAVQEARINLFRPENAQNKEYSRRRRGQGLNALSEFAGAARGAVTCE
jgi:hypothetical protein